MNKAAHGNQQVSNLPTKPLLIVLSGPSGVGKDAVLSQMKESGSPLHFVITLTTRTRRTQEKDNVDYRFVSADEFRQMLESNQLLESAHVYGNWYGVPREDVKQALERGQDVVIKVDIQGAATIKKLVPQAVTIFLTPPSIDELSKRLKRRRTESPGDFDLRLKTAGEEMKQIDRFDYSVINRLGKIDLAVAEIQAIITAEKDKKTPREVVL